MNESTKPSRHLFWPVLLTSLIGFHIVSVVVMVIVATHDSSFALEPDWYVKGLHYEQTLQQRRENGRLNWSVKIEVGPPMTGSNRRTVACTIGDASGTPVENATVDLVAFAHLRASNRISGVLLPPTVSTRCPGGKYTTILALDEPGLWEFRLVVTRGPDTFTDIVKQEI
jgi:nitrogen fixation protein FixH